MKDRFGNLAAMRRGRKRKMSIGSLDSEDDDHTAPNAASINGNGNSNGGSSSSDRNHAQEGEIPPFRLNFSRSEEFIR
jgi:hypothetical protein